jgi:hypothetical protein
MLKFIFNIVIVSYILSLISCNKQNIKMDYNSISIDIDNSKKIDLRDISLVKLLPLEITESSLLEEIQEVEILDNKILVYTNNKLIAFDQNGKFIFDINRKGNGPGEYSRITSFFVLQKKIYLFDDISQKLLVYDANGKYISTINRGHKDQVSVIYPVNESQYIAKNRFQGKNKLIPSFSLLDNKLIKIKEVENKVLKSAEIDFDHFCSFNNNILYWEFLNDTIYSFDEQNLIIPKYVVDFNNYSIPANEKKGKETNQIIEYLQTSNIPKIATGIKYINEDSVFIRFVFVQKEGIVNYAKYNKKSKIAKVFQITDSQSKLKAQLFMAFIDGKIIMSFNNINEQDNPKLAFIDDEKLL